MTLPLPSGTTPKPEKGRSTLVDSIEAILVQRIDERVFPHGLIVGEAAIARVLNVSRTPVRNAITRLENQGKLMPYSGRGSMVSYDGKQADPIRLDIAKAGLLLDEEETRHLDFLPSFELVYPEVERAVSSCMAFGRFQINQTAMAAHFGTSRTVILEVLARLEISGLVVRDRSAKWYVRRLTQHMASEHYAMRTILEPEALLLAAPHLNHDEIEKAWAHVVAMLNEKLALSFENLDRAENDLHFDLIDKCPNATMLGAIRNSQLPLIATHFTRERYAGEKVIHDALLQHLQVLTALREGAIDQASAALRRHLEHASKVTVPRIAKIPKLTRDQYPDYFVNVPD